MKNQGFAGMFLRESALTPLPTRNEGNGYNGEWSREVGTAKAVDKFKAMFLKVALVTGEKNARKIGDYLDSKHGRYLAGVEQDKKDVDSYIKKDYAVFSRTYRASDFEDWE